MRLAPITGVYGLSFVFAMMAAALALAMLRRPRLELAWLALLAPLALLPPLPPVERGRESALLVQPDISVDEEWTTESLDRVEREQVDGDAARRAGRRGPSALDRGVARGPRPVLLLRRPALPRLRR